VVVVMMMVMAMMAVMMMMMMVMVVTVMVMTGQGGGGRQRERKCDKRGRSKRLQQDGLHSICGSRFDSNSVRGELPLLNAG
jgi:hypothetical protein